MIYVSKTNKCKTCYSCLENDLTYAIDLHEEDSSPTSVIYICSECLSKLYFLLGDFLTEIIKQENK